MYLPTFCVCCVGIYPPNWLFYTFFSLSRCFKLQVLFKASHSDACTDVRKRRYTAKCRKKLGLIKIFIIFPLKGVFSFDSWVIYASDEGVIVENLSTVNVNFIGCHVFFLMLQIDLSLLTSRYLSIELINRLAREKLKQ